MDKVEFAYCLCMAAIISFIIYVVVKDSERVAEVQAQQPVAQVVIQWGIPTVPVAPPCRE